MGAAVYGETVNPDRDIMIQKVIILCLTIWVGTLLIQRYTMNHGHPYEPLFKAKSCFSFYVSSSTEIDGMVMYTKEDYYVVLWYKEADKRYGGPKMGSEVPIKWLDTYASPSKCPNGWRKEAG